MLASLLTPPYSWIAAATYATPPSSVTIDESDVKSGHGPVYRVTPTATPPAESMLHVLLNTVEKTPDGRFLGHRPLDENGNALDFVWSSYAQVYQRIQRFGSGLKHNKMLNVTADGEHVMCIYMKNSAEWIVAQYGAMYCGAFCVALYDTLGADSTEFILNQTLATTVVCTTAEFSNVLLAKSATPTLEFVVLADAQAIMESQAASAKAAGVRIYTMGEIEAIGSEFPSEPFMPTLEDIYCLIYTSGTTGNPKGVPLTHRNVLCQCVALHERIAEGPGAVPFTKDSVHLSYLPLAHSMEHMVHANIILHGACIGMYQGNTLKLVDDLVALRPTFFATVPRLLNKMYDKIVNGANAAGGFKAWLFNVAKDTKLANLKQGYRRHAIFDALIFSKVQQKLGLDRCTFIATGSAPLATDVMDFFRILFNCPIHEGYGQSETSTCAAMTHIYDSEAGTVGPPLTAVDIKLVSAPDMGYNVTDTFHGDDPATRIPVHGRGEICFRGVNVTPGYYKAPDKTAETFDEEGWLHSGDIGVWTVDGRLRIVDRKKNIFKLSQGEYIAPEKIENILLTSPYVAQPFVYGDSLHSVLVAIIVPDEDALMNLAKTLHVSGSFAQVCENKQVVAAVLNDLVAASKKGKLFGFETIKALKLHPTPFTVENDLMTPTFKMKRFEAK
ncbi:hypothetical protein LEN26_018529 [Aphanomyces euteiches]|nr:hypothetical protein LEN26_018529 [Aphanomyces euteiches]